MDRLIPCFFAVAGLIGLSACQTTGGINGLEPIEWNESKLRMSATNLKVTKYERGWRGSFEVHKATSDRGWVIYETSSRHAYADTTSDSFADMIDTVFSDKIQPLGRPKSKYLNIGTTWYQFGLLPTGETDRDIACVLFVSKRGGVNDVDVKFRNGRNANTASVRGLFCGREHYRDKSSLAALMDQVRLIGVK